ncbi:MAG: protein kinase [Deltaproteobacteria bacterium]|nr:protein kinase [Deltaproteobacteria bacterium]
MTPAMPGTDQGGTGGADDPFGILGTVLEKRYRLDAVVGEGGFGVVYRALHLGFDAPVAVKVLKLPPGLGTEARQKFLKSFANEGRLLFDLGKLHPGFRQVSDTGVAEAEGRVLPFLVQEWLEGQTLRDDLLGRRAQGLSGRPLAEVVQLLDPVARALAVAHGHKVAHRDVKPANVFLAKRDGSVTAKLLDFGVAKVMAATGPAALRDPTKDGLAAFSMEYAAPEQWMRKYGATGPWTDVYALALICVELLTERPALDGDDYQQLLGATLDPERPTPNRRGASVPEAVERLFAAALAIDPGTRPRHAGEFWDELVEKAGFGQASRDEQQTCRDVASTTPHRLAPTVPAEPFQVAGGGQQQQATVLASPEELPQVRTTPQFPAIGSDAGAAGAGPSPRSARPSGGQPRPWSRLRASCPASRSPTEAATLLLLRLAPRLVRRCGGSPSPLQSKPRHRWSHRLPRKDSLRSQATSRRSSRPLQPRPKRPGRRGLKSVARPGRSRPGRRPRPGRC